MLILDFIGISTFALDCLQITAGCVRRLRFLVARDASSSRATRECRGKMSERWKRDGLSP